mgnify:FL=1|tara:strand:- start:321 stop:869 length:549 start_codon:yes stop_codon:yes gene_type:complete
MKIERTPINDLLVIQPKVYEDSRGNFFESWNKDLFKEITNGLDFVQDNQSYSKKNVLRGLHFQNPPYEQGKLVRVIKGSVLDVAVDIRKDSDTYGSYYSIELNDENKTIFWIPPGFAHGFLTLKDNTIFSYKCTSFYNKDSEGSILWNDKDLNIYWGIDNPIVSNKDASASSFKALISRFNI